jgi:hypothetical protein
MAVALALLVLTACPAAAIMDVVANASAVEVERAVVRDLVMGMSYTTPRYGLWGSAVDVCAWDVNPAVGETVMCDAGRITKLSLTGQTTSGTIPDAIGALDQLTLLSLHANGFTGTIPSSIGLLTRLRCDARVVLWLTCLLTPHLIARPCTVNTTHAFTPHARGHIRSNARVGVALVVRACDAVVVSARYPGSSRCPPTTSSGRCPRPSPPW